MEIKHGVELYEEHREEMEGGGYKRQKEEYNTISLVSSQQETARY